jgi:hypothetical protein
VLAAAGAGVEETLSPEGALVSVFDSDLESAFDSVFVLSDAELLPLGA